MRDDLIGAVAGAQSVVCRPCVEPQARLAWTPGRACVSAIGQRENARAMGADAPPAPRLVLEAAAFAMEEEKDRLTGIGRHVPSGQPLAVAGRDGHAPAFRDGERAGFGQDAGVARVEQQRALREEEGGHRADVEQHGGEACPPQRAETSIRTVAGGAQCSGAILSLCIQNRRALRDCGPSLPSDFARLAEIGIEVLDQFGEMTG